MHFSSENKSNKDGEEIEREWENVTVTLQRYQKEIKYCKRPMSM